MPAEWEPHAATWLAWPHNGYDWPGKGAAIPWVFCEMARHLTQGERVRFLVRHAAERKVAQKALADADVPLEQIDFLIAPTNRSWTRDYLPQFLVRHAAGKRPSGGLPAAVKFRFDGWSRYPNHLLDDAAGRTVAKKYAEHVWSPSDERLRTRDQRLVLEGGSIDVDGEGTLLTTEECLFTGQRARMKPLGKDGIESLLGDHLAVDKVLWLPNGVAGDDTSGHIDDFARFVAPGRVVIAQEPNARDENHRPLRAAWERLDGERDARGRKLELIALPMPSAVGYKGARLPASYANFLLATECVLVPTFNDPKDREALGIMAELFPKHRVVGIHALDLVVGLGTLHCSSQQEPAA